MLYTDNFNFQVTILLSLTFDPQVNWCQFCLLGDIW